MNRLAQNAMGIDPSQVADIKAQVREEHPEGNWMNRWQVPVEAKIGRTVLPIDGKTTVVAQDKEGNYHTSDHLVGKESYCLLPDEVLFHHMKNMIPKDFGENAWKIQVSPFHAYFEATFPTMAKKMAKVGDSIAMKSWLSNGSNGKIKLKGGVGAERLVCSNGMTGFKSSFYSAMRHNGELDLEALYQGIKSSAQAFSIEMERWNTFPDKIIPATALDDFMVQMDFGPNHQEEILALPIIGVGSTVQQFLTDTGQVNAWDLYNACTQFLTHNIESDAVRMRKSPLVEKAFTEWTN